MFKFFKLKNFISILSCLTLIFVFNLHIFAQDENINSEEVNTSDITIHSISDEFNNYEDDSSTSISEDDGDKGREDDGEAAYYNGYKLQHGLLLTDVDTKWHEGSFKYPAESLVSHYREHGREVGAEDPAQYLRKAVGFSLTAKKGSTKSDVDGYTSGVIRYKKNGKYIDLAPDGRIVSYGSQDH